MGGIALSFFTSNGKVGFIAMFILGILITIVTIALSFSEVIRKKNNLILSDMNKSVQIDDIVEIKKWWNYDFGFASAVNSNGPSTESRMHVNNINCYVKFIGKNNTGIIYEQIVISDKFPNHLEYSNRETIDESKLVKVWNIDNCLEKIRLNNFQSG